MNKKLNFLIIHTDEHVYRWLGCMGNKFIKTPNIDQLANEGMLFSNAYTCNGVCVPSRASLLTGRHAIAHGIASNEQRLPQTEKTMGHYFHDNSYVTGYFGKAHYGGNDANMALDGWQESFIGYKPYNQYLQKKGINIHYPEGDTIKSKVRYWKIGASNIPTEHYFENVIADKAISFMRTHKENPFLCFVGNIAPHGPFTPPKPYDTMYNPADMIPAVRHEHELDNKPAALVRWIRQNQKYMNEEELKIYLAHVYGLVTLVDDNVGKIVTALKQEGLYEKTMIIFTADHGDFGTRYGIIGKSWCMIDNIMRVPLIISNSEHRQKAQKSDALTSNVDILPTMMEYAGIRVQGKMQGISLRPILEGEQKGVQQEVFGYNQFRYSADYLYMSMIRHGPWKYVHSTNYQGELYNLENDPDETVNLIFDKKNADLVNEMRKKLLDWHVSCAGGLYDVEKGLYWEDDVDFYDETKFDGTRHSRREAREGKRKEPDV